MRVTVIPNVVGALETFCKGLEKKKQTWRTRKQRKSRDHPVNSIVEIGQNTLTSPRDKRNFAVTQTPVKEHQLGLEWKHTGSSPCKILRTILKMKKRGTVIYWPSTEPSIKRCTCVNKRKNSGSRWTLENNITRFPGGSSQLETGCQRENQQQTEGFGPLVTPGWATQAKMRKKCCYGREKNLGQYSSPFLSPFISHTQQTSPFRK